MVLAYLGCGNAVPLQKFLEDMDLTKILLLGIVAYLFSSEKKKYEELEEKSKDLEEAAKNFGNQQTESKKETDKDINYKHEDSSGSGKDGDGNSKLSDLEVSYLIRVGDLLGKKADINLVLYLCNKSEDKTYILNDFKVKPTVCGIEMGWVAENETQRVTVRPGQTVDFYVARENNAVIGDKSFMEMLKNAIKTAAGKKLFTSVTKNTDIKDTEADVEFYYIGEKQAGNTVRAIYNGQKGTLRYCGTAWNANR